MIKSEQHRKNFAVGISVLTTLLTFVSLSASYSTYLEGFRDWGGFGKVLAVAVTAGGELAFALLVYGIVYALIGAEFWLGVFGALTFLAVMAVNFHVHTTKVKGFALAGWQLQYEQWVGAVVPFYAIALLLLIGSSMFESRERRQARKIAYLSKQKALDFKEEYLESEALTLELEPMKPLIAAEVKRQLALPGIATAELRQPGFAPPRSEREADDPKA